MKTLSVKEQKFTGMLNCSLILLPLRGLLDDESFHQGISEISQEPVPYFRQLGEAQVTASSRPSSGSSQSSDQSSYGKKCIGELDHVSSTQVFSSYM